jgi:hypothetical protein
VPVKPPRWVEGEHERPEHFAVYQDYNRVLRAWFVAYGIGAPVLFVSQDKVFAAVQLAWDRRWIISAFMAGVLAQILITAINKWSSWSVYSGFDRPADAKKKRRHKFARWVTRQFWIDVVCDLVSLGAFGYATTRVLFLLA